ncbi:hypothetical protein SAMN03159406_04316 [Rhizobium sp. NFR03]|nr:hypothetical protein SAMN03159406_04316 [Rhizobium sp. NFR03]
MEHRQSCSTKLGTDALLMKAVSNHFDGRIRSGEHRIDRREFVVGSTVFTIRTTGPCSREMKSQSEVYLFLSQPM